MMLLVSALGAVVAVQGVTIQEKLFHGYGTEVFIGTPPERFFVAPDFSSTESRLFAGAAVRSPFLPPIPHSRSLQSAPGSPFPFVDNATLADVHVRRVGISLETERSSLDALHYSSSQGRLGLGPQSAFAQAYNISLRSVGVSMPHNPTFRAIDMTLVGSISAPPEFAQELNLPLVPGASTWAVNASLRINDASLSSGFGPVELDPTASDVELPISLMSRLQVVMRLVSRDAFVEPLGRLWLPCNEDGRISIPIRFILRTGAGDTLDLSHLLEQGVGISPNRHPDSGHRVCPTVFKVSHTASTWRLNPRMVSDFDRVVFDARNSRVIIRRIPDELRLVPLVPGLEVLQIPVFGIFNVREISETAIEINFPPQDCFDFRGPQYVLKGTMPEMRDDGRIVYTFTAYTGTVRKPTVELEGVFKLSGERSLRVNQDKSVSLPLLRVEESTRGRKYKISVEQTALAISLVATPLTAAASLEPLYPEETVELVSRMIAARAD